MPKELSAKQFRKGTKSCVECRQRKLRCIPSSDDSQPCQNCAARGRSCLLQTHVGRNSDTPTFTSKDRIHQLEDNVSRLWAVVRELKTELGHPPNEPLQTYRPSAETEDAESDSEISETSPMNPPTHLQQLFENELVDPSGNDGVSTDTGSSDKASNATLNNKARTRLQALMPSKQDVAAIASSTSTWMSLYTDMFPTINMFTSGHEMLAKYDSLMARDAHPAFVAALLLSIALSIGQAPPESLNLQGLKDVPSFTRQISHVVDEVIVSNDVLASTSEGIETSLLWIRLQFIRPISKKLWLKLRRTVALAELIGLPRAAQRARMSAESLNQVQPDHLDPTSQLGSAATLWQSICALDRLAGVMFGLPIGTASYSFHVPQSIMSDGRVIPRAYLCHLLVIAGRVQEIDDAHAMQRPEAELFDRAFKANQDLRSLSEMTPSDWWWSLGKQSSLADQLLQYWYYYFTARVHLQLALRNSRDSQYAYSFLACMEACKALSHRYVNLRGMLPQGFFAGRVLDLQAMTAAVFLLYTCQRSTTKQALNVNAESGEDAETLVQRILQTMDSISNQPGGDFGKLAAKAIRELGGLFNQDGQMSTHNVTLKVPLLGKISIRNHAEARLGRSNSQQAAEAKTTPSQDYLAMPAGVDSWTVDFGDSFPVLGDNAFETDQWLSYGDFDMTGLV